MGGTGFIGYHLAQKCLKKNFDVTSLSSSEPNKKRYLKKIKYIKCDISKKNLLKKSLKKNYDYVVNLGGYVNHNEKIKTFNSHYIGCKNLADIFLKKKIETFLQIGSSVEYGNTASPQREINIKYNKKLHSTYGSAKLLASEYLNKLYDEFKFPSVILRLYLIYGPEQEANRLIPIVIKNCLLNKSFPCSSGLQKRDFLFIDDLVLAIIKCLKNKRIKGKSINIGYGIPHRVIDIIKCIKKIINSGNPIYGKIKFRKDEIKNLYPDINRAKTLLKWKPKVSIIKGLKLTINDYRKKIL